METKLWIGLCALLVINMNLGSAEHDESHPTPQSAPGPDAVAVAPTADSGPASSPDPTRPALNGSDTNLSSGGTGSVSGNTTTEEETVSMASKPRTDNETNPTPANPPPSHPPPPASESHAPTTHSPSSPVPATTTHTALSSSAHTPLTTPLPSLTHHNNSSNSSTTPSPRPSPTQLATAAPTTPEPPKPETTTTAGTTSTQTTSPSSTSSSQAPPTSPSSPNASQTDKRPEASTEAELKSTAPSTPSSTSVQAKTHAGPSQLNVGSDTTMVHDSPALDPLLAGLVSAFIITAVIITLLLFLKLRRRDNRPEFRRLQDLPMDDMMEDTPLSMYSY